MAESGLDSLSPLIAQARYEGMWLYCSYQNLWFSPDRLAYENSQGRFRWSAENWRLRSPREHEEELILKYQVAKDELERFRREVGLSISDYRSNRIS